MQRIVNRQGNRKKLLLTAAGLASVGSWLIFAPANASPHPAQSQSQSAATAPVYEYDVVSVKPSKPESHRGTNISPDGYTATNVDPLLLIYSAFGIRNPDELSGAPGWTSSDRYDIDAKIDPSVVDALQKLSKDDRALVRQQMMRKLLADRFKLQFHRDTRELSVYALVVAKNGLKMKEAQPVETNPKTLRGPDGHALPNAMMVESTPEGMSFSGQSVSIASLINNISRQVGRIIIDKTGLTANYEFTLQFMPEQRAMQAASSAAAGNASAPPTDSTSTSIFTAIQEQLGLKLESVKAPIEVIIIDHIERPSGN